MNMNRLVKDYFGAFNRKDGKAWLELFADEGSLGGPAHYPPVVGKAALRELFGNIVGLFDELNFEISAIHVQGPFAVALFTLSSRAKNGHTAMTPGMVAFAANAEGKFFQVAGFWDPMPVLAGAMAAGSSDGRHFAAQ